ncbi:MAG: hypothetical protein QXQ29_05200 [Candidatus Bathyarchaeia archaeon]
MALKLLDVHTDGLVDLAAPSLLPYGVLNAIRYSRSFAIDEMKSIANALDDLQIQLYDLGVSHL